MSVKLTREQALRAAWSRGLLSYKIHPYQQELYNECWRWILEPECMIGCGNLSRRWGKTFVTTLIAVEICERLPGAVVRMAMPTREELKKAVHPAMRLIIKDAPEEYRPKWRNQDHAYVFPNGSEIHLVGVNGGHANELRGAGANLALVDEAAFITDLKYLIESVLGPQLLTTNGTILVTSTPPQSPAHHYVEIAMTAKAADFYLHRDIFSTHHTQKTINRYIKMCGGENTSAWKREYLALFVIDDQLAIIPEWNSARFVRVREPHQFDAYWHRYEAMDLGVRDNTVVLFSMYNFMRAKLCIEAENVLTGHVVTTPALVSGIRSTERALGYDKAGVYRRVADNSNLQLLNDLRSVHGLSFSATTKEDLPSMVNTARVFIKDGHLEVDPNCKNLISCLETGIWRNEKYIGREFARMDGALGHFDALAALIYKIRNLDRTTNPVPADLEFNPHTDWCNPLKLERASDLAASITNMFATRRSRR